MVSTKRLLVDAKTGREEYADVELEVRQATSLLEGRDIVREFDDLLVLLKSKGVI